MSSFNRVKLRWARKLLGAKMFVVMTEKESAIAIDGADPRSFTDALALAAQAAELEMFQEKLGGLIVAHHQALKDLNGEVNEPTTSPKTARSSKTTSDKRKTPVRKNTNKATKN